MARLILGPDATRDEWLAERKQGVTASEIAAILSLSPWESARSLYHLKRGEVSDDTDADHMRWGRRLEAPIADEFADRHPELLLIPGGLYAHDERPWQLATPDRRLFEAVSAPAVYAGEIDPVSTLEIKTGASLDEWGDDGSDEIPTHYRCQVLWQMDVLGVTEARVALLVAGRTYREYTVAYDPDDAAFMRGEASTFLQRVHEGTPPDVDDTAATQRALKQLHPDLDNIAVEIDPDVATEYDTARTALKAAEDRKRHAENQLREQLGNGRYATSDGHKLATRSVYQHRSIDTKRLRADQPDLANAYTKETTVNKIQPAPRKKESS